MSEVLERRARSIRARASIRQWEYRLRRHANGVWGRLTRLLADASHIWEIDGATANELVAEGCQVESVGLELEPAKTPIVVPTNHPDPSGVGIRPIPINIGAEFLAARSVALRRFP